MIRLTADPESFSGGDIADGRPGRKSIPKRRVLEAVLWLLNTGAQLHMLPQSYPNYKTVHRRFQAWCGQATRLAMDASSTPASETASDALLPRSVSPRSHVK